MTNLTACATFVSVCKFTLVLLLMVASISAQQMPTISGESLSGHALSLPSAAAGHPALVIAGFSQASKKQIERWTRELISQFKPLHPEVQRFQIAVIQDAPRLLRGMITRGMKSSVPASEHDHFLILTQEEDALKRVSQYSEADDAYLMLFDGSGKIVWQTHGDENEAAMKQLLEQAGSLTKK